MKLIEFIQMMREAASFTGGKETPLHAMGQSVGLGISHGAGGIDCHVYLTAQGEVSEKETGIEVSFHVPSKT